MICLSKKFLRFLCAEALSRRIGGGIIRRTENFIVKTFILMVTLCFSAELFAREILLATITGNIDTDTSYFEIEVNDINALDTVRFRTVTREGRVSQDSFFPAETVDATGAVLIQRNDRDILRLETVKPFSFETGGEVKLTYLYSGVTNSWKALKVKLVKAGDDFEVRSSKGEKITRFYTKGNWHPIFGLIGIADLVPMP